MRSAKIKKHFSLYMVEKCIINKKKLSETDVNNKEKKLIPKFLDPINCFYLPGDVCFVIDSNSVEIGVFSTYNLYKQITNVSYNEEKQYLTITLINTRPNFDSWELLSNRLKTLGNRDAYNLSNLIDNIFINIPLLNNQNVFNDKNSEFLIKYNAHLEEIENSCFDFKNELYLMFKFQTDIGIQGLKLTEIRQSKAVGDFYCEDIQNYINQIILYGIIDVFTIEGSKYFDYMIKSLQNYFSEQEPVYFIANTIENFNIHIAVVPWRKMFSFENFLELNFFVSFTIPNELKNFIEQERKMKQRIRSIKGERQKKLEFLLSQYYSSKNLKNEEKEINLSNEIKKDENDSEKRCGFKTISQYNDEN